MTTAWNTSCRASSGNPCCRSVRRANSDWEQAARRLLTSILIDSTGASPDITEGGPDCNLLLRGLTKTISANLALFNYRLLLHACNAFTLLGIFDVTIAFLDPENVDFDVQYAILLTLWINSLCIIVLMSAILENGAVCESHTLPTMSSRSFVIPHPMINFRHADKYWYSAATYSKTRVFFSAATL